MPFVQFCPTAGGQYSGTIEPIGSELAADVVLKKFRALDPAALGHSQQFSFFGDQPAIHVVELLDEMFDARIVEAHPLDVLDHCRLELLVAAFCRPRQLFALVQGVNPLILKPLQLLVDLGDGIERREYTRLQLSFHSRKRDRTLLAITLLDGDVTLDPGKLGYGILLVAGLLVAGLAISL